MKKVLVAVASASAMFLAGCASEPKTMMAEEQMVTSAEVTALQSQIDLLKKELAALKKAQKDTAKAADQASMKANQNSSMLMEAQESATRANERIDNIAESYTK